ncbi:hypothetical protein TrRE_jg6623, partial [Triparma retinervis]
MNESADQPFPDPPTSMINDSLILEGDEEKMDEKLSQSQLDDLASKLSPSFSLYNVDELFLDDDEVGDGGDISNIDIGQFESEPVRVQEVK